MKTFDAFNMFIQDRKSYCEEPTVKYYNENVFRFLQFLEEEFNIIEVAQVKKDHYIAYLSFLRGCDIKNTTIHTYLRAVRAFVNFCLDNNIISEDITHRVKLPKSDAALKVPLSAEEVDKIDACFDLEEKGIRNYIIVHLMLDMGLRRQEVINLKRKDVDFGNQYAFIEKSKNNKSRVVPVPEALLWTIYKYICVYNRNLKDEDFLLKGLKGEAWLTEDTIKQMFQKLKKESGINRLHAHLLRHTFASSYILYCGDIYMLKVLLGHSEVNTTEKYVHIANQMKLIHYDLYKIDKIFFQKNRF